MKKLLLVLVGLIGSLNVMAHNPLAARFELEATSPRVTLLHVYLSQTGLHQALLQHYPTTDFTSVSVEEYKRLAVTYLKEHVSLTADGVPLILGEGGIKVGSHETDFKFLVDNYPERVERLDVDIMAFTENEHHTSIFWWRRTAEKSKLILSVENGFRGQLGLSSAPVATRRVISGKVPVLLVMSLFGTVGLYYFTGRTGAELPA